MTKYYTVYKITRISTGQIYIGIHQTANLDDGYMGSGKRIMAAVAKYGLEDFKKEILFIFKTEEEMTAKEKELVTEEFCKREDTYNIAPGGFGGGWKYVNQHINKSKWSSESGNHYTKAKKLGLLKPISNIGKHGPVTKKCKEAYRKKYPKSAFYGKFHSEETKIKMSKSHLGKHFGNKNSQFGTIWLTDGTKNIKIKQDEQIPEGWYKGRSKSTKAVN